MEATAQQNIASSLCTDEGHQAEGAGVVLNFILWAGLYTGLGYSSCAPCRCICWSRRSCERASTYPAAWPSPRRSLSSSNAFAHRSDHRDRPVGDDATGTAIAGTLAYVFALLFAPKLVLAYAAGATERVRGFIASYPDNVLYEAVAAVEAGRLGTVFSGDTANTLRSYFRVLFKRLNAPDQEVLWPKSPLAWRVFFVQHYGAMLPGLARYFAPGTSS